MIPHRLLPVLLIATCLATPALAQINPYRGSTATPLNADDIAALTAATQRLFDRPQLVAGGTETWSNTKSGASGTVTAGNPTQRKGLACRAMLYDIFVPGPRSERKMTLVVCPTKDGLKVG